MWRMAAGAGTLFTASTAGYLYWERNTYIADVIKMNHDARESASQQCSALEAEIARLKEMEKSQQLALEDKMGTVEALWNERERRIALETRRAADGIFASPEVFSVLSGLQAHCNDSANKMPLFYEEFDLNASKIHTIGMLIAQTSKQPRVATNKTSDGSSSTTNKNLRDISSALGMFRSDPVISAVSLFLRAEDKLQASTDAQRLVGDAANDTIPESTAELSRTFSQLMQHFQNACAQAVKLTTPAPNTVAESREKARRAKMKADREFSGEQREKQQSTATSSAGDDHLPVMPPSLGFFTERIVPAVAEAAHMTTTIEADMKLLEEQRDKARQEAVVKSWRLYSEEDVFAAVQYVAKTHRDIVEAAAKGEPWARHQYVAPAVKNLCVWALAAEQYLSELQTQRVLENITRATSHNFVQINEVAEKGKK